MRIDLHLQLQLQVHKKLFHHTKYPDFDPSSLATISTWKSKTWYALLCSIDYEPQKKVSARTDSILEIRIVLWAYKEYKQLHIFMMGPHLPKRQDATGLL